ncbi:hypothetical protein MASR1M45_12560 [Candidatus Kapaibacterium sp.]
MSTSTFNPTSRIGVKFTANVGRNKLIGFDGALCGAGAVALGVTEYAYNSGDEGSVITGQTALLTIKAALSAGDFIASDVNGDGVLAVAGDVVNGILLKDCEENDEAEVLLSTFQI